jgi:2'-5' RNA ligase
LLGRLTRRPPGAREGGGLLGLGFVILVSEDVHNAMRRLQLRIVQEYGANSGIEGPPHLTLKQGFAAPAIEPFEQYLDRVAAEIAPFEITLRGIDAFDDGVIFLDVAPNPALEALRRRVVHDLATEFGVIPNALEGDRFRFHATLAQGLPRGAFERARQALRGVDVEYRFVCDTLGLLCDPGSGWITYKLATVATQGRRPSRL